MIESNPFVLGVIAVVIGVLILKIFFTLWKVLEKKLHPNDFDKPTNTPETAFKDLKKKIVNVYMKNGDILKEHKYKKTLYFGDEEYSWYALVYFELEAPNQTKVFISSSDILKIETTKDA
ncbi:MAG: hypothetical protein PF692_04090 [Kiritimatiellae bacterium]|jgi:hypothetical protein|nr:hypothetical protein [Kiritimatiellia bacterium]